MYKYQDYETKDTFTKRSSGLSVFFNSLSNYIIRCTYKVKSKKFLLCNKTIQYIIFRNCWQELIRTNLGYKNTYAKLIFAHYYFLFDGF